MKLLDFLKTVNNYTISDKLISIHLLSLIGEYSNFSILKIANNFRVSVPDVVQIIDNFPLIEIDNTHVKFLISELTIIIKTTQLKKRVEPTPDKKEFIENVLSALNHVTNKGYKYSAFKNRTCILARINEGYTFDEFLHVIKCQSIKWLGTKDELYLRPETLFGTKMEGYVNSPVPTSPNTLNKLQKINDAISQAKQFDWESISKPPAA
jgi:uncharacterized phage protein (TIGR02220 family)